MPGKRIAIALLGCVMFSPIPAFAQEGENAAKWLTYKNDAYGYEIKYPEGMEFLAAGVDLAEDDLEFLIRPKGNADSVGIYATLYPGKKMHSIDPSGLSVPSLRDLRDGPVEYKKKVDKVGTYIYKWELIKIGSREAIKGEAYHENSKEIFAMFFIMDDIFFNIEPWEGFDEPLAEEIISTFKLRSEEELTGIER